MNKLTSTQLIFLFFGVWSVDLIINGINSYRDTFVPSIGLDHRIPFVPAFIYLYSIYFPLVVAPLFIFRRAPAHLRCYVFSSLFVMIVSYIVFLLFPTRLIRVPVDSSTLAMGVTLAYQSVVGPYNLLPSLHVSMLILSLLSLWRYKEILGRLFLIPNFLSMISVVLTKQHYIMDVITALPLSFVAFLIFRKGMHDTFE